MELKKRLLAEFLGSAGLLTVIVGSGIMGETLSQGNDAIALLANSIATGAGLYVLIQTFAPISGAHFNPAVSLVEWLCKRLSTISLLFYALAQVLGAVVGVMIAHAMFAQTLIQHSTHDRNSLHLYFSEVIATFGLIAVILIGKKENSKTVPASVALYITAAYWFTSSTSFANPAVTIARSLTNTFSGIQWNGAPGFIGAQLIGAAIAFALLK